MDPSTLSALHIFTGFICCYVGGMLTMTLFDDGDTSFIKAAGHFFIGWPLGLVIATLITDAIPPLAGVG